MVKRRVHWDDSVVGGEDDDNEHSTDELNKVSEDDTTSSADEQSDESDEQSDEQSDDEEDPDSSVPEIKHATFWTQPLERIENPDVFGSDYDLKAGDLEVIRTLCQLEKSTEDLAKCKPHLKKGPHRRAKLKNLPVQVIGAIFKDTTTGIEFAMTHEETRQFTFESDPASYDPVTGAPVHEVENTTPAAVWMWTQFRRWGNIRQANRGWEQLIEAYPPLGRISWFSALAAAITLAKDIGDEEFDAAALQAMIAWGKSKGDSKMK